eukprot:scaffold98_cov172-Amphora_coffeaeformis.AAC.11
MEVAFVVVHYIVLLVGLRSGMGMVPYHSYHTCSTNYQFPPHRKTVTSKGELPRRNPPRDRDQPNPKFPYSTINSVPYSCQYNTFSDGSGGLTI